MNRILALITVSVILISCQKEINFPDSGSNNGGSNGALLVKSISKSGTDSTEINYFYDNNKRLVRETTSGIDSGQEISTDIALVRNSSGIITQSIYKSVDLLTFGIDSVITNVYYDNNSKKYTATSFTLDLGGSLVIDSTVYTYSGNSIIESKEFQTFFGITYIASKTDFSYTGTNLTLAKTYVTDSSGNFILAQTDKVTYDNKISTITMAPIEAVLLANYPYVSSNNPLTVQVSNDSGSIIISNTISYSYNSSNRPQSAKISEVSGRISTTNFYYQ